MRKIIWEIQYLSQPPVFKYCKKCGVNMEFTCSMQFRVNAQRRYLDIWLIYKCAGCDATWNAAVYSRISPQSLSPGFLEGFYNNDKALIERYAMDRSFLRGNGVVVGIPVYSVIGEDFSPDEAVELEIKSNYSFPLKVSSIVRDKLRLSQKEYSQRILNETIKSKSNQDLQKCKLSNGLILIFNDCS